MHTAARLLWEQEALGSNPRCPISHRGKYMPSLESLTTTLSSPLPFNGFMLIIIGVAIYFAYNKGHLQKVLSFFKKTATSATTPTGLENTVSNRAAAYQLLYNHVKGMKGGATKAQLDALETISGTILKEQEK